MKSLLSFGLILALNLSADNVKAQLNITDKKPTADIHNPSNIDLAPPVPEPQFVIGDDGQKVYFSTKPATVIDAPPVIIDERRKTPPIKDDTSVKPN